MSNAENLTLKALKYFFLGEEISKNLNLLLNSYKQS